MNTGLVIIGNTNIFFGIDGNEEYCRVEKITNLPATATRVKIKLRRKCEAVAFVKDITGIHKYVLERDGDGCRLAFKVASNSPRLAISYCKGRVVATAP